MTIDGGANGEEFRGAAIEKTSEGQRSTIDGGANEEMLRRGIYGERVYSVVGFVFFKIRLSPRLYKGLCIAFTVHLSNY